MKSISRRGLIGVIAGTLGALLLGPGASAGGHPAQQMQNSKRCYSVDETFYKIHDLKVTKEIRPIEHCYFDKDHPYRYSVVDIPVSLAVGTVRTPEFAPDSWKDCPLSDRLLRADWTVWSEGQVVSSGSSTTKGDAEYTKDNIFKFLGSFPTLPGKRYVVEMKFTKDGTPLNVANPHLIVTKMGDE